MNNSSTRQYLSPARLAVVGAGLLAACGQGGTGVPRDAARELAEPPPAPDTANPWPITTLAGGDSYDARFPSLDGDLLTWTDLYDDDNGACMRPQDEDGDCKIRILAQDLRTGDTKVVARELWGLIHPRAAAWHVAWRAQDNHIHTWSFESEQARVITEDARHGRGPLVAGGGTFAWVSTYYLDRGISLWDPALERRYHFGNDEYFRPGSDAQPTLAVHGTRFVVLRGRQGDSGPIGSHLWTHDAARPLDEARWLTDSDDGFPYAPALAGNTYALGKTWFQPTGEPACNGPACEQHVYAWSIDGIAAVRLADDEGAGHPSSQSGIATAPGYAAWLETGTPFYRVVAVDLATGERVAVSPPHARPVGTETPAVSADWLVWTDAAEGRPTIVGIRLAN